MSGIQRYIRMEEGRISIDIFRDGEFSEFRKCLGTEMKMIPFEIWMSDLRRGKHSLL